MWTKRENCSSLPGDVRYLREGLLCLSDLEERVVLYDLESAEVLPLEPATADIVWQLLEGVDDPDAREAVELLGEDLTQESDEPFDPVLRRMLAELDRPFSWLLPPGARWLVDLCETAHSALRHIRDELDQLPVLPETAARRALLLRGRLEEGARVALVGDDDLLAIPMAALGLRPTVFDVDETLLAAHRRIAARLGLEIERRILDLHDPLPPDLLGRYDAFCTDPETSRECVTLFLSRGVSLVRPGGVGLTACAEEWVHLVEAAADEMRVRREGLLRRFGNYRSSRVRLAPYRSDLFVLAVAEGIEPIVPPGERYEGYLFPFGLTGEDHLLATIRGCDPRRLRGPELAELAAELAGERNAPARIEDRCPFPVRQVTASGDHRTVQVTVHADGTTVDLDMAPSPASNDEAMGLGQRLADTLGARELSLKTLRRLE